jgi:hypothetical protein
MEGRNSSLVSQDSTVPAVWLIGALPAAAWSILSRLVSTSPRLTAARSNVADSQATTVKARPATRCGR